jgi:hypothetical protein
MHTLSLWLFGLLSGFGKCWKDLEWTKLDLLVLQHFLISYRPFFHTIIKKSNNPKFIIINLSSFRLKFHRNKISNVCFFLLFFFSFSFSRKKNTTVCVQWPEGKKTFFLFKATKKNNPTILLFFETCVFYLFSTGTRSVNTSSLL